MPRVERVVCIACGGVWFTAPNDKCPSCGGMVETKKVDLDNLGHVIQPKPVDA